MKEIVPQECSKKQSNGHSPKASALNSHVIVALPLVTITTIWYLAPFAFVSIGKFGLAFVAGIGLLYLIISLMLDSRKNAAHSRWQAAFIYLVSAHLAAAAFIGT